MKLFISYSRDDASNFAKHILRYLREKGHDVFIDVNIKIGDQWNESIKKNISNCDIFIVILTPDAITSTYIEREVLQARRENKVIVPCIHEYIDYSDIKWNLEKIQGIKFSNEYDLALNLYSKIEKYEKNKKPTDGISKLFSKREIATITVTPVPTPIKLDTDRFEENKISFETQLYNYKKRIIEDFKNFSKNHMYNPIVKNFKKYDGYHLFVSQRYNKIVKLVPNESNSYRSGIEKTEYEDIFTEILNILKKSNHNFIPIVGNYGSGKSLLSLYVLYTLCDNGLADKDIIPLYVPLGSLDYYTEMIKNQQILKEEQILLNSIFNYIKKEYEIIDDKKFLEYSNSGKIIFILDAFDELTSTIDEHIIVKNLQQIENLANKGNRVILTSRYTYLSNEIEKWFIEGYDLYQIEDFDDELIEEFLDKNHHYYSDGNKKEKILQFIKKDEFYDLAKKPLFLQIVYSNYEKIQKETIVNPATIFKSLTDEWIDFDIERKNISEEKKIELKDHRQRISEILAISANQKNNTAISKKDIIQEVADEFRYAPMDVKKRLDSYYVDAQKSTFLIKQHNEENEDTFSFIYKSVMEYFVARRIVTIINNHENKELFLKYCQQIITDETFAFIHYIMDIDWGIQPHVSKELLSKIDNEQIIQYIKAKTNNLNFIYETFDYAKEKYIKSSLENPNIGNLITLLYSISDFGKFNNKKLTTEKYSELNFSNCNLNGVNLPNAILIEINLHGANLVKANLKRADLKRADLGKANLEEASLGAANLYEANLVGANLYAADLWGANLQRADLRGAILQKTDLIGAQIRGANLQGADLQDADLERAYLRRANLQGADLRRANLQGADLLGANLQGAIN